jgi:phospholipase C
VSPLSRREFLLGSAAAGGLAALGTGPARAGIGSSRNAPIDHVVVVMMENRSFDHLLGWLPGSNGNQAGLTYVDSQGGEHHTAHWAPDYKGCGHLDPGHGWDAGRVQLGPERKADGFIRDGSGNDDFALGYYTADDVPVWAALTEQATVFDNYFCALLGPTYPNREYQHAATSGGRTSNDFPANPVVGFQDRTIWDACNDAGISWAYYYSNLPVIGLYGARLAVAHADKVRHISAYYADAALGRLPQVAFVDPFFVAPEGLANDDHPHADIRLGQQFLSDVIGAFQESPNFARGALFVNYDEWGGFYDTVVPGRAPADDRSSRDPATDFSQRGFRTPATVVSPYARRGAVASGTYDHTSILKFVEWRFGIPPLTRRDATARNIGEVLDFGQRPNLDPVVPAYVAPPDARVPCPPGEGFEGSDLMAIETSGLAAALGLRTDWAFADSYRSF